MKLGISHGMGSEGSGSTAPVPGCLHVPREPVHIFIIGYAAKLCLGERTEANTANLRNGRTPSPTNPSGRNESAPRNLRGSACLQGKDGSSRPVLPTAGNAFQALRRASADNEPCTPVFTIEIKH